MHRCGWASLVASLVATILASSAQAQQALPAGLISGQMNGAYTAGSNWCAITQGTSVIQRNGSNSTALISFPQLTYQSGSDYYARDGAARLTFTGGTSGTVKFKGWGGSSTVSFNNYSQTLTNGTLYVVAFQIVLPTGCTLSVNGVYEVAP